MLDRKVKLASPDDLDFLVDLVNPDSRVKVARKALPARTESEVLREKPALQAPLGVRGLPVSPDRWGNLESKVNRGRLGRMGVRVPREAAVPVDRGDLMDRQAREVSQVKTAHPDLKG